jgi:hypothetical protein
MQGKLNLFQVTMLHWRELHPYNAAHVVVVEQTLEPGRLKACIAAELESAGLTGLFLARRRRRFAYRGGEASVSVSILPGGDGPRRAVDEEIERQLNLPFAPDGAIVPFRFFAVDGGGSFHLGLVYDHFIAGGDSIALLLGRIVARYGADAAAAVAPWTPRLYPRTYRALFAHHAGYLLRGLRRVPALVASSRRSCRAPCRCAGDASNAFLSQRVDAADVARLVRTARDWGVSRNDLFLAMLLWALAQVAPERSRAPRRRELGVATIVNVRAEFEADAVRTFGQFLASLRVSHPVQPGIALRELARAVNAETTRIKTEKLYLQTLLALGAVALAWRFLRADRRRCFLAKHYPIWAGVTSLDIDALWRAAPAGQAATDYLRAVPTGPLAPIVVAITTVAGRIELGVSFRRADVSREFVAGLMSEFVRCIHGLN